MAKRWYAVHALSGSEDTAMRALEQRVAMHGLENRFGRMLVPSGLWSTRRRSVRLRGSTIRGTCFVKWSWTTRRGTSSKTLRKSSGLLVGLVTRHLLQRQSYARLPACWMTKRTRRNQLFTLTWVKRFVLRKVHTPQCVVLWMRLTRLRAKIRVTINIFGRPVSTELGFHQVEKLS